MRFTLRRWSVAMAVALAAAPLFAAEKEEAPGAIQEAPIAELDRKHWSFRPLARPEPPSVKRVDWVRGDIDRFVLALLEERNLAPAAEADRRTLVRRLYFDLTGLPPMPDQVEAFLADRRPDAWERLVDKLLDTPAYGERWAQHWLDLARFAETDGFEFDAVRPDAWKYRDWVIDALNRDMPYDKFLAWQLAGDELEPGNPQARIATGFCLAGPDMPDINSKDERRDAQLNELTATVGAVFLGLQLGCAQCHDHKYDPLSQADFYRLRAIFAPGIDLNDRLMREKSADAPASYLMIRGDWRRRGPEVQPAFPRIANLAGSEVPPPGPKAASTGRRKALAEWLTRADHPLTSRVIVNRLWQFHFGQGLSRTPSDFGMIGDEPRHAQLLDYLATQLVDQGWSLKQMHRLMVTSATYRTASRLAADADPASRQAWQQLLAADPENRLLGRFQRQRLSGEAIRDAMLVASGRLSDRRGGPGIRPPLPEEVVSTLIRGDHWKPSPPQDWDRRSIYVFARRNLRLPMFEAFDRPDGNASCAQRNVSTTAPQSLELLNSRFSLDMARALAGYVLSHAQNDARSQIDLLFARVFGRPATAAEQGQAAKFLAAQSRLAEEQTPADGPLPLPDGLPAGVGKPQAAALVDLSLALMNANEFLYVD